MGPRREPEGILAVVSGTVAGLSLGRRGEETARATPVVDDGGREAESDPTAAGTAFIPSDDGGVHESRWHGSTQHGINVIHACT